MKIETIKTETVVITEAHALDPITVVFRDSAPSQGGIIVECYGKSWATFWCAMGHRTVRDFIVTCDADYIVSRLWRDGEKRTKAAEAYLLRITTAILAAMKGGAA